MLPDYVNVLCHCIMLIPYNNLCQLMSMLYVTGLRQRLIGLRQRLKKQCIKYVTELRQRIMSLYYVNVICHLMSTHVNVICYRITSTSYGITSTAYVTRLRQRLTSTV